MASLAAVNPEGLPLAPSLAATDGSESRSICAMAVTAALLGTSIRALPRSVSTAEVTDTDVDVDAERDRPPPPSIGSAAPKIERVRSRVEPTERPEASPAKRSMPHSSATLDATLNTQDSTNRSGSWCRGRPQMTRA